MEEEMNKESIDVSFGVKNIEDSKSKIEKLEPILVSVDEEKNTITVARDYKSIELSESDLRIISVVYNNMIKKQSFAENNNINIKNK